MGRLQLPLLTTFLASGEEPTIHIQANRRLVADLRWLQGQFRTPTLAATVRWAIARDVVLQRALADNSVVCLQGRAKAGRKHFRT